MLCVLNNCVFCLLEGYGEWAVQRLQYLTENNIVPSGLYTNSTVLTETAN